MRLGALFVGTRRLKGALSIAVRLAPSSVTGDVGRGPASLQVVAAYRADDFTRLLRTGVALGGRELGTMGPWARAHLSQLTDSEIGALYSYLHELK